MKLYIYKTNRKVRVSTNLLDLRRKYTYEQVMKTPWWKFW